MNRCLTLLLAVAMTALTLILPATAGASSTRSKKGSVHVRHITIHHAPRKGSKHGRKHKHKHKHHAHKRAVHHTLKKRSATAADELSLIHI